jgi:hypothetical protein
MFHKTALETDWHDEDTFRWLSQTTHCTSETKSLEITRFDEVVVTQINRSPLAQQEQELLQIFSFELYQDDL